MHQPSMVGKFTWLTVPENWELLVSTKIMNLARLFFMLPSKMASQPHVYGVIKNTKLKPKEHVDELVNLDGQNSSKAKDRNSRIIPNKRMCSI